MFNENDQQDMRTYRSTDPTPPAPPVVNTPAFESQPIPPVQPNPWFTPAPGSVPASQTSIPSEPITADDPEPSREPAPVPQPAAPSDRYVPEPEKPKKQPSKNGFGKLIAIALVCSLFGGIIGSIGTILATRKTEEASPSHTQVSVGERESTVIDIQKIDTSKIMTPAEVYATYVSSTVGITTSITTNFWGYQTTSAASGSGFIISSDGYILTNHHVIEDSSSITVSFYDGSSKEATLIGYDASNDLAVLKVDAENLRPVVLGDSDNLNVGDTVLAIGNPLGELTFTLTVGTLSALNRDITTSTGVTMSLMQTDCAINSGNSGGALFNLYGEVIGITNAKYSSSSSSEASIDNIGFAIPLNNIRKIVDDLIENGYISKPYIGVSVSDVSAETQSYGLPEGASVQSIVADSPAEKAGLQINDIITAVDDKPITGSSDLVSVIKQCEIGQVLKLSVYRKGVTMELELTVGEQVQQGIPDETQQQQQQQQQSGQGSIFDFPFWDFGY